MNCADFETIVSKLAENRPMDATARVNGLAHVTICRECAARLRDTRSVHTGLQLAATAETEEAPARVRGSLLASFAEHHNVAGPALAPTPISKGWSWQTVHWWGAAAVAAAAIVVLALLLPSLLRVPSPQPPTDLADTKTPAAEPTVTPTRNPKDSLAPDQHLLVAKDNLPVPPKRRPAPIHKARLADQSKQGISGMTAGNDHYFPLTYLASATAMESGTVVRIQVSRAKLISLGLPMDGERANELVKADLVLGDDGVARAIRLVP